MVVLGWKVHRLLFFVVSQITSNCHLRAHKEAEILPAVETVARERAVPNDTRRLARHNYERKHSQT